MILRKSSDILKDNSLISCVFILLVTIDIVIVDLIVVLRGCHYPSFISRGHGL
jgi:hypothetical protein